MALNGKVTVEVRKNEITSLLFKGYVISKSLNFKET